MFDKSVRFDSTCFEVNSVDVYDTIVFKFIERYPL